MSFAVATIVEGHGEVDALPVLLRRLRPSLTIARPVRVKRQRVVGPGELERYAQIAESNIVDRGGRGAVLCVLDADDDCAATLGPSLAARIRAALPHRTVGCVIVVREYESWLVAGDALSSPAEDEQRGTKVWLVQRYGSYVATRDQARLTASADLERMQALSRSFRHLLGLIGTWADSAASG